MKLKPQPSTKAIERLKVHQSYLVRDGKSLGQLVMRIAAADASPLAGAKKRSLTVVLADESPVQRWDANRYMTVSEILLMEGVQFRAERRQLPLVDSGDVSSVRNIVGSVRSLRVQRNQLIGEIAWARDKAAQVIAAKWQDGHLDEFSVISQPIEVLTVNRDQQYRGVQGPANFVTKWMPLTAVIGQDKEMLG